MMTVHELGDLLNNLGDEIDELAKLHPERETAAIRNRAKHLLSSVSLELGMLQGELSKLREEKHPRREMH